VCAYCMRACVRALASAPCSRSAYGRRTYVLHARTHTCTYILHTYVRAWI